MNGYLDNPYALALTAAIVGVVGAFLLVGYSLGRAAARPMPKPPTSTEVEADSFWDNFTDVIDANAMPLSQSPAAQRIRHAISETECAQFRDELDQWGRPA